MSSGNEKSLRNNIRIFHRNSQEIRVKSFLVNRHGEVEKNCSHCKKALPWYDFSKSKRAGYFVLAAWCKECVSSAQEKKKITERRKGSAHRQRAQDGIAQWRCNGCGEHKDVCDFSLRKAGGEMIPRTHCRKCRSEYDRARTLAKNRI